MLTPPPLSENELLESASRISGKTLQQIANQHGIETPDNQLHHKGWVGQLLELSLGATASSLPEPDFQYIGVELKISRVMWLPIEADPDITLAERRIGSAILWSPDKEQEAALRRDWEELMDMIATGELEQITAHQGKYLQVRPKAANTKTLTKGIDSEGKEILTLPRGFYLRTKLTNQILHHAT
jgi:DNA mismatch repair protein MutH